MLKEEISDIGKIIYPENVGIVLVNYNNATDTIQCIESLRNMSKSGVIIVVDNASTDNSVDILKKIEGINLVCSEFNRGFAAGCNIGFLKAIELKSNYVWYLNNDTVVDCNALQELLKTSKENNDNCLVGILTENSITKKVESAGGGKYSKVGYCRLINDVKKIDQLNFISGCSMFASIAVFKRIGSWDESYFLYWEDVDYSHRAQKKGIPLMICSSSKIFHKESSTTCNFSISKYYFLNRNNILFFKKNYKLAVFAICMVVFRILRYAFTFRIKSCIAAVKGLLSGFQYKMTGNEEQ
jgi:GT2 family glycosyltransferase